MKYMKEAKFGIDSWSVPIPSSCMIYHCNSMFHDVYHELILAGPYMFSVPAIIEYLYKCYGVSMFKSSVSFFVFHFMFY